MKNKLFVAWNVLAIWALSFTILGLLLVPWFSRTELILSVLVSAIVAGALSLRVLHKEPERWARLLFTLWLGLIVGSSVFLITLLFGVLDPLGLTEGLLIGALVMGIGALLVFVVLTQKKPVAGLVVAVIVALATANAIYLRSQTQVRGVRAVAEAWQASGWPLERGEIFPYASTREQCEPWFEAVRFVDDKGWNGLYKDLATLSRDAAESLATGGDAVGVVAESGIANHPLWSALGERNLQVMAAMDACPRLQWFDPEAYEDRIWAIPHPDYLSMVRWSRGVLVEALHLAGQGDVEGARVRVAGLHAAAGRMQMRGQTLLGTQAGIMLDRLAAVTAAGIQSHTRQPLGNSERELVEAAAAPDLGWFLSSLDAERYARYAICRLAPVGYSGPEERAGFLRWRFLRRSSLAEPCRDLLGQHGDLKLWLTTVPNLERDVFAWHEARRELGALTWSSGMPDFLLAYSWALTLKAQWRLVLACDEVLRHLRARRSLPEDATVMGEAWPVDPFADAPLLYLRHDPSSFTVYSLGPDELDQGGEPLLVLGAYELEDAMDTGLRMTVR